MNTNKIVIYVTIIAITLIIFVPTFYKVVSINQQRLNEVNEKLVTENAFRCYYEEKCQKIRKNSTILLKIILTYC